MGRSEWKVSNSNAVRGVAPVSGSNVHLVPVSGLPKGVILPPGKVQALPPNWLGGSVPCAPSSTNPRDLGVSSAQLHDPRTTKF